MKRLILLALPAILLSASPYKGMSPEMAASTKAVIEQLPSERANEFISALEQTKKEYREGMGFLITYMPEKDLKKLPVEVLKEAVNFGYKAREEFQWCKDLPQDIFFNDVLPYASMDETRELWREEFYNMFKPLVAECTTAAQAIDTVNKSIEKLVQVSYNTKRKKPNQSPHESMEIHMASCSGLSILLTDAFRSVGIPSRIGGTPMWVSREGNHNWSEVWLDGKWYFTEFNPDKLNHSWFLVRAAAADTTKNPIYQVYVTSFKPTENNQHFVMVWNFRDKSVPGEIVTSRYAEIYRQQQSEEAIQKGFLPVIVKAYKKGGNINTSADRIATDIAVFGDKGPRSLAKGTTAGPKADMNNYLTIYLPANGSFTLKYGQNEKKIEMDGKGQEVVLWID